MSSDKLKSNFADICALVDTHHLAVVGALHPLEHAAIPNGTASLFLLGPKEPGFWPAFKKSNEFLDGLPNPIDRWSKRVITSLAAELQGKAIFPFGPPPYAPFFEWAQNSKSCWQSPVSLLVHSQAGLFVSFRGALALPYTIDLPKLRSSPCETCQNQPCRSSCPVGALTVDGYDTETCRQYLGTAEGKNCMDFGCAVRRSCPVSKSFGRLPEQSAHHMKAFVK